MMNGEECEEEDENEVMRGVWFLAEEEVGVLARVVAPAIEEEVQLEMRGM